MSGKASAPPLIGVPADSVTATERGSKNKAPRFVQYAILCIIGFHVVHYLTANTFKLSSFSSGVHREDTIGTLKWFECDEEVVPGMDCGSIAVPLDYFNHTKGVSTLALARYNATATPKRGTIFLNPGGPGGSGVQFVLRAGPLMAQMLGPYYDLVGFDPRGIGKTVPAVQCFSNPVHRQFFASNTVFEQGFSVSSNLSDPNTRNHLVEQFKEFLALKQTQADLCAENMGEELSYMGSTTVARDIDFMTTTMDGEDALINYFGASYGTILGAYLVNMFPDRIGKAAIDGVANPVLWAGEPSQYWHRDWISSAEDTFKIFLHECSKAGTESCPLAKHENEDPQLIGERIDNFLDKLYIHPLPVPNARRPGYLTSGGARALLLIFMERPVSWPDAAKGFSNAMSGDGRDLLNMLLPKYITVPSPDLSSSADLSRLAVTCLDSPPPASAEEFPTAEELADIGLGTIKEVSPHFGMSVSISEPDGGCQYWPVEAPERFSGPWNHTLKNPILIVSNTADPVTPIASGRLVNKLLGNSSRLLIQESPGHCSLALTSLCTINAYRAYFINGTLPSNEHVCKVNQSAFPRKQSGLTADFELLSEEDTRLLAAGRELSQWMAGQKWLVSLGNS